MQIALERDTGILFNGKCGLRLDTCSSTDNILNDSSRLLEKSGVLLQIENTAESSDDDPKYHVFSLADSLAYFTIRNHSKIFTIEKSAR